MKLKHIQRYLGIPVLVQLRDAMALAVHTGLAQPAPIGNAEGKLLLPDGSLAPTNARGELLKPDGTVVPKGEELQHVAVRPVWPIAVRKDEHGAPEFRFAIENAMVSVLKATPTPEAAFASYPEQPEPIAGDELVQIHYFHGKVRHELVVEPDSIIGITCVREGPMPEEKSRIVRPPN